MEIIEKLELEKARIESEREPYKTESDNVEIETINQRLNLLVQKRNDKQSIYSSYDKQIQDLDIAISVLKLIEAEEPATLEEPVIEGA